MYLWTAEQIYRDPWVIYQRQVKPHKLRIILRGLANTFRGGMPRKMRY
jgi:phytoene synthase